MGKITDIPGVLVGHSSDFENATGCTVILFENSVTGCVDLRGGGTSTRQIDGLFSHHNVGAVNAILLTGGSAFGLNASSGVMRYLEEKGKGIKINRTTTVPSVPTAVIYDLGIGNSRIRPDDDMAYKACISAGHEFEEGSVGAGTGATIGKYLGITNSTKGGIASLAYRLKNGLLIGVLTLVNSFGNVYDRTGKIIAGVRDEKNNKFLEIAGLIKEGVPQKSQSFQNTTICLICTNASFSKTELLRIAMLGSTGVTRTINPCHTISDGDLVFALSCGEKSARCNDIGILASELITESIIKTAKVSKGLHNIPGSAEVDLIG